ncbi:hypothetical protein BGZ83_005559 [Gryganskiella cystojenkinii]|nr:hypothetical protein BGZ83_005559 [Gryganskiella cystojenkinii]
MASALQIHPQQEDISISDPSSSTTATANNVPGVAYDLKRLKVYSSCLRCRAKKVKCDRKEPCSRCEKHSVECSYRELASVQLDIRQFQRHLNNPKIKKDGSGIITSTATPVITMTSNTTSTSTSLTLQAPSPSPSNSSFSRLMTGPETATAGTAAITPLAGSSFGTKNASSVIASFSVSGLTTNRTAQPALAAAAASSSSALSTSTINTFASYSRSNGERSRPGSSASTDTESDSNNSSNLHYPNHRNSNNNNTLSKQPLERTRVYKVHRRKPSSKSQQGRDHQSNDHDRALHADLRAISDHVDRVQLSEENNNNSMEPDTSMSSASDGEGPYHHHHVDNDGSHYHDMDDHDNDSHQDHTEDLQQGDIPIWRVQALGKHMQTAHEQDMAETFGLAAYLKAREMEIAQDPERAGQTLDFEMELERALAQRMPSSFSRPDRSFSRARKNSPNGYSPRAPYARPAYCQLSPGSNNGSNARRSNGHKNSSSSSNGPSAQSASLNALLTAAQCCCQISALQGQALSVCPYSNVSHSGYEKPRLALSSSANGPAAPSAATTATKLSPTDTLPPPTSSSSATRVEGTRIAYSPSYSPTYNTKDVPSTTAVETTQSSYPSPQETESPLWQYTPSSKLFSSSSAPFPSSNGTKLPSLSVAAPCLTPDACSMDVDMSTSSPRTELPPILSLPVIASTVATSSSSSATPNSDLTVFQVGKDGETPIQIECKYNEPNIDAWDMIEKPISRTIPLTTKRGRSIKMEMGWILS